MGAGRRRRVLQHDSQRELSRRRPREATLRQEALLWLWGRHHGGGGGLSPHSAAPSTPATSARRAAHCDPRQAELSLLPGPP